MFLEETVLMTVNRVCPDKERHRGLSRQRVKGLVATRIRELPSLFSFFCVRPVQVIR